MARTVNAKIENLDFIFENSPVRIVANRSSPEIKLAGLCIGPFDEGGDYEVPYWVAVELSKSGLAHFHSEDMLDSSKLSKIQWTERVQTAGQVSSLPEGFYPKLRRLIRTLREGIGNNPEKIREYERVDQLTKDIVNSRLKKIVSISSSPAQTENALRNLTDEERLLYAQLFKVISKWKTQIMNHKETSTDG
jgi:hypothetical protein